MALVLDTRNILGARCTVCRYFVLVCGMVHWRRDVETGCYPRVGNVCEIGSIYVETATCYVLYLVPGVLL